ncbi:MAG: hypothetical protein HKO70_13865 [Acidimicrobiia bacterium]|nr:hypothetical protein [Acidimicrobiia bacterium]
MLIAYLAGQRTQRDADAGYAGIRASRGEGRATPGEAAVARLRSALRVSDPPPNRRFPVGGTRPITVLVLLAVVACGIWVFLARAAPVDPASPAEPEPVGSIAAAGVAEIVVSNLLGDSGDGTDQMLEPFTGGSLPGALPGDLYVQNVAAIEVGRLENGWTVVVAAQVLRRIEGGYGDPGLAYYRVELTSTDPPTIRRPPEEVMPNGGGWVSPNARRGEARPGGVTDTSPLTDD